MLVKESRKALYISELSEREQNLGLRVGMPLAHAKAIAPHITHHLHDEHEASVAFAKLAQSALRFSPQVAIMGFGLLINITGCAHLFGGEELMLATMSDFFLSLGFITTVAIAPYPRLAKALAHFAPGTICNKEDSKAIIKTLPIDALFAAEEIVTALDDLAIATLDELLRLPRKKLAARFGLAFLHNLDQLMGAIHEPPTYLAEEPQFLLREPFSLPVRTHEQLMQASAHVLTRMLEQLVAHNLALHRFTISFIDIFKKTTTISIEAAQPHNDFAAWYSLLVLKTETVRINQGIDALSMHAIQVTKAQAFQRSFTKQDEPLTIELAHITDQLKSRLGQQSIYNLRILDHHLPEQAVEKNHHLTTTSSHQQKLPPRPVRLLKKPLPISAISLLPDNPPKKIMWQQRSLNVLHASGPERIEAPWWLSQQELPRDYYAIEDDRGKRLWIYSTGMPKQWFIHGVFA